VLHYTRTVNVPRDIDDAELARRVDDVAAHVTAELSSRASANDDPDEFADRTSLEVRIVGEDGKLLAPHEALNQRATQLVVSGALDAEPDAPYLKGDYDPYDDVPEHLRALVRDDTPEAAQ
jgi:hypothetical protein